tara:strand:+ start:136 stop:789 length:654 start_codon:yes stop_codon:yes gene_type:complete
MKSVKIGTLNPNPKNPRLIKDEKYKLLLHSVKVSPAFMLMNPIKVDLDNMILCGNMRYKACMELQKEVVPVEVFTKKHAEINNKARREEGIKEATYEEQCLEYIIKDNVSFGEHDWSILDSDWENDKLREWGMDVIDLVDNSEEGDDIEIPQSLQVMPKKEYILIMADEDSFEWDELKTIFKCETVRMGGCRKGSSSEQFGTERVFDLKTFRERVGI